MIPVQEERGFGGFLPLGAQGWIFSCSAAPGVVWKTEKAFFQADPEGFSVQKDHWELTLCQGPGVPKDMLHFPVYLSEENKTLACPWLPSQKLCDPQAELSRNGKWWEMELLVFDLTLEWQQGFPVLGAVRRRGFFPLWELHVQEIFSWVCLLWSHTGSDQGFSCSSTVWIFHCFTTVVVSPGLSCPIRLQTGS